MSSQLLRLLRVVYYDHCAQNKVVGGDNFAALWGESVMFDAAGLSLATSCQDLMKST